MKKLFLIIFVFLSVHSYAQKSDQKDLKYYYYFLNQDKDFKAYLDARREFDHKKFDFKLPASKEAVAEIEAHKDKILKNQRTYAAFLEKYGMTNAGEYAELWYKQMHALKVFLKKNPEFYQLTAKERQSVLDKWYYAEVASNN